MKKSYLHHTPCPAKGINTIQTQDGTVILRLNRKNGRAITLGKKHIPNIYLDRMEGFIWSLIDGKRTLMDISSSLMRYYSEEEIYPRVVALVRALASYRYVYIK